MSWFVSSSTCGYFVCMINGIDMSVVVVLFIWVLVLVWVS